MSLDLAFHRSERMLINTHKHSSNFFLVVAPKVRHESAQNAPKPRLVFDVIANSIYPAAEKNSATFKTHCQITLVHSINSWKKIMENLKPTQQWITRSENHHLRVSKLGIRSKTMALIFMVLRYFFLPFSLWCVNWLKPKCVDIFFSFTLKVFTQ